MFTTGKWVWIDGNAVLYTDWAASEPDNTGFCGRIAGGSHWRDMDCDRLFRYVCKKPGQHIYMCVCVCVCVCVCARACVRVCVCDAMQVMLLPVIITQSLTRRRLKSRGCYPTLIIGHELQSCGRIALILHRADSLTCTIAIKFKYRHIHQLGF